MSCLCTAAAVGRRCGCCCQHARTKAVYTGSASNRPSSMVELGGAMVALLPPPPAAVAERLSGGRCPLWTCGHIAARKDNDLVHAQTAQPRNQSSPHRTTASSRSYQQRHVRFAAALPGRLPRRHLPQQDAQRVNVHLVRHAALGAARHELGRHVAQRASALVLCRRRGAGDEVRARHARCDPHARNQKQPEAQLAIHSRSLATHLCG